MGADRTRIHEQHERSHLEQRSTRRVNIRQRQQRHRRSHHLQHSSDRSMPEPDSFSDITGNDPSLCTTLTSTLTTLLKLPDNLRQIMTEPVPEEHTDTIRPQPDEPATVLVTHRHRPATIDRLPTTQLDHVMTDRTQPVRRTMGPTTTKFTRHQPTARNTRRRHRIPAVDRPHRRPRKPDERLQHRQQRQRQQRDRHRPRNRNNLFQQPTHPIERLHRRPQHIHRRDRDMPHPIRQPGTTRTTRRT